jgi:hypothetical protein
MSKALVNALYIYLNLNDFSTDNNFESKNVFRKDFCKLYTELTFVRL